MPNREDVFAGGPGLDAYAYQSEVYCPGCARKLDFGTGPWTDNDFGDSEVVPFPVFFGESDAEQDCAQCGVYLYGERIEEPPDYLLDAEVEDRLSAGGNETED